MSGLFGSGELNSGYVLDNKPTDRHSTRLPLIITDGNVICGRRIVFGANDIDIASQLIASLIITNENATQSIESPRFHMLNGTIGIEGTPNAVHPSNLAKNYIFRVPHAVLQRGHAPVPGNVNKQSDSCQRAVFQQQHCRETERRLKLALGQSRRRNCEPILT